MTVQLKIESGYIWVSRLVRLAAHWPRASGATTRFYLSGRLSWKVSCDTDGGRVSRKLMLREGSSKAAYDSRTSTSADSSSMRNPFIASVANC